MSEQPTPTDGPTTEGGKQFAAMAKGFFAALDEAREAEFEAELNAPASGAE